MAINYEDERFTEIEEAKTEALTENEAMYDGMIGSSDKFYQAQIDASKEYADKQTQLQQQQTDFTIEQIQQQKDQAHKDYLKEQSAAYTDYQKQSNEYSVGAEQRAANGLSNTGYSESSQVAMYNAYQNRVATARDSYNRAVLNYDNGIKEAQLQNSAKLAEIAYTALQQQLELSLQGFQYKNQLLLDKYTKKLQIDEMYYSRFQDTVQQINQENALAEQVRQFNEQLAEEKRQFDATMAYNKGKSSGSSGSSSGSSDSEYTDSGRDFGDGSPDTAPKQSTKPTGKQAQVVVNTFKGKTYDEAVTYLKENGSSDTVNGLLTEEQWKKGRAGYVRKGSGQKTYSYSSYSAYLKAYIQYSFPIK
jgi:hypothetical protein